MKRVSAVAALFSALVSGAGFLSPASAQEVYDDGIYIRVGAGVTFASDLGQSITYDPSAVFAVAPATTQTSTFGNDITFATAIGFDYDDGIRTELEYRYAATDIETIVLSGGAGPDVTTSPSEQFRVHFLMSNFFFDFPNDSAFTPFIGGGVGGGFAVNHESQQDAALAYQGRAGIALDLGGDASVDLEYVYLRTNDFEFATPTRAPITGVGGDSYQSSSAMISFRKKF